MRPAVTRVHCPTCNCDIARRVVVNTNARFYDLVLQIDRILYDEPRTREAAVA